MLMICNIGIAFRFLHRESLCKVWIKECTAKHESECHMEDQKQNSSHSVSRERARIMIIICRVSEKACKLYIIGREAFVGIAMQELQIHHDA